MHELVNRFRMGPQTLPRLTLVLGGARLGKSRYAERLIERCVAPWLYIATAQAYDDEMRARIAEHRNRRGGSWQTVDAPLDLADAICDAPRGTPVLVDCLTLWLSNVMLAERDVESEQAALISALENARGQTVVVTNEVGLGIVPETRSPAAFAMLKAGSTPGLQRSQNRVVLIAAGLPLILKRQSQEGHAQ